MRKKQDQGDYAEVQLSGLSNDILDENVNDQGNEDNNDNSVTIMK